MNVAQQGSGVNLVRYTLSSRLRRIRDTFTLSQHKAVFTKRWTHFFQLIMSESGFPTRTNQKCKYFTVKVK